MSISRINNDTHLRSPAGSKLNPKRNIVKHLFLYNTIPPNFIIVYYSIVYTMHYKNALESSLWAKNQTKGNEIRREEAEGEVM